MFKFPVASFLIATVVREANMGRVYASLRVLELAYIVVLKITARKGLGVRTPSWRLMTPEPKTMKSMCETIAFYHLQRTGKVVDPEMIFNYSPTGELSGVFDLYYSVTGAVSNLSTHRYEWPDIFNDWLVPE